MSIQLNIKNMSIQVEQPTTYKQLLTQIKQHLEGPIEIQYKQETAIVDDKSYQQVCKYWTDTQACKELWVKESFQLFSELKQAKSSQNLSNSESEEIDFSQEIDKYDDFVAMIFQCESVQCTCTNSINCQLCHNTKHINISKHHQELNQAIKTYLKSNLNYLRKFYKEKYQLEISSIEDWARYHKAYFMNSDQSEMFIFRCAICKTYFGKVNNCKQVFISPKNVKLCTKCYSQQQDTNYQKKVASGLHWTLNPQQYKQESEFMPPPPNLSKLK